MSGDIYGFRIGGVVARIILACDDCGRRFRAALGTDGDAYCWSCGVQRVAQSAKKGLD